MIPGGSWILVWGAFFVTVFASYEKNLVSFEHWNRVGSVGLGEFSSGQGRAGMRFGVSRIVRVFVKLAAFADWVREEGSRIWEEDGGFLPLSSLRRDFSVLNCELGS
jgi:hypothetical protein